MGQDVINCRLRPSKDDDIKEALAKAVEERKVDLSDIVRAALRYYLIPSNGFISTQPIKHDTVQIQQPDDEKLDDIKLEKAEKSADQLDDALNSLLNDF